MKAKRKNTFNPKSTQVAFVINTVAGKHLDKQCLLVSVNGHLFVLTPRTIQKRFRFYDSGFNIFIEPKTNIQISIAVLTPSNNRGYMHSLLCYNMQAPTKPRSQNLELHSYGNTYIVSLSLYVSPNFIYDPVQKASKSQKKKLVDQNNDNIDFNPNTKKSTPERQKKKYQYDSLLDEYSFNYSISPSDSSSYINLDQDDENIVIPKNPTLLNPLSEYSQTDETSTLNVSSDSD